jgi:hypothetical protein
MELEVRVKIRQLGARVDMRQLKELEVFDSLRLSVVVATEAAVEVAGEVAAEVAGEVLVVRLDRGVGNLVYCCVVV